MLPLLLAFVAALLPAQAPELVAGATPHAQAGQGQGLVRPLEYLAVTSDGLTYGFMNGMRPRVMILFPLRRNGNRLEGMMRWGGVDAEAPDGAPPPMHVELRKTNIR